jgi:hypothetical protein
MRLLNANPVIRAASAARGVVQLSKYRESPEAAEACARGAVNGAAKLMRRIGVPEGAEAIYKLARFHKFSRQAAVEMAQREARPRERVSCPVSRVPLA